MGYSHYKDGFKVSGFGGSISTSAGLNLEFSSGLSVGIPIGEGRPCTR
jgi:hypothetical protein